MIALRAGRYPMGGGLVLEPRTFAPTAQLTVVGAGKSNTFLDFSTAPGSGIEAGASGASGFRLRLTDLSLGGSGPVGLRLIEPNTWAASQIRGQLLADIEGQCAQRPVELGQLSRLSAWRRSAAGWAVEPGSCGPTRLGQAAGT